MELVWNMPVPYSTANPVALERNPMNESEGAGRAWLYVEPDGDVQPDQSIQRPMGNLLTDPWAKIWKSHIRVSNA
jgi:MoaA/NifB/PqqE/SkfB family radical SAM enzyme